MLLMWLLMWPESMCLQLLHLVSNAQIIGSRATCRSAKHANPPAKELILQGGGGWGDEPTAGGGWGPDQETGSSRYEGSQSSSGARRSQVSQKEAAAAEYMQSLAPPPASSIKVSTSCPAMAGMLACLLCFGFRD